MSEENVAEVEVESKSSRKSNKKSKKITFLNKVIIRKLPPNLTEEMFLKVIDPIPDNDYFYFVPVDWTLGSEATSRAYIHFINEEDIFIFKDKFDGYVFVDSVKGTEYPAIVEFAPFQGLLRSKARKRDKNVNTIEEEAHFKTFLESLNVDESEGNKLENKLEFSYTIKDDKKITSTPLLEFIANKMQEKRDNKRRRNEERKKSRDIKKISKPAIVTTSDSIKEEIVYDDGVVIRTVPSRCDRKKNIDKDMDKDKLKLRDHDKERENQKPSRNREKRRRKRGEKQLRKPENPIDVKVDNQETEPFNNEPVDEVKIVLQQDNNIKSDVKRYSKLRKDRNRNTNEEGTKKLSNKSKQDNNSTQSKSSNTGEQKHCKEVDTGNPSSSSSNNVQRTMSKKSEFERNKQRIKNKDRPALEIYQPKRRTSNSANTGKSESPQSKSSDEISSNHSKSAAEIINKNSNIE